MFNDIFGRIGKIVVCPLAFRRWLGMATDTANDLSELSPNAPPFTRSLRFIDRKIMGHSAEYIDEKYFAFNRRIVDHQNSKIIKRFRLVSI